MAKFIIKKTQDGIYQVWDKEFKNCPWVDGSSKNAIVKNLKKWGYSLVDVENPQIFDL